VIQAKANNVIVNRDVAKDPAQTELISRYRTALGPIATKVVGSTTAPLTRDRERLFQSGTATNGAPIYALGESPLGNVIADAQLAATQGENAVAALMNPGGVRADLNAAVPFDGAVTYEEAFTVQPFANNLVTLDLTGAQLQCLLEQQFQGINSPLYPSSTLTYDVDRKGTSAAAGTDPCTGTRVPDSSVEIGGTPVVPTSTYRITVNNFLAGGGDGFTVFKSGTNAVTGAIDLDAFIAYLGAESPLSAPTDDRITAIN
jgi:5'-nucleotidase